MSKLVIVESPAKAKTIEKYLGKGFKVKASVGHVRDIPKSSKGAIDIEAGFVPNYQIIPRKKKVVKELKDASKKSDGVILATDPDREGEAIAWHVAEALGLNKKDYQRIVFHEITEEAVQKALENPRNIDDDLKTAQEARRVLDRLFGYELSALIWKKVRYGLSAGRVQSPALRILMEREREIRAFEPETYWTITANVEGQEKTPFDVVSTEEPDEEERTNEILKKSKENPWFVKDVEEKQMKRNPRAPFTTSTLQQTASSRLGFSPARTMRTAQKLYEAGLITYMRTDSITLSGGAQNKSLNLIEQKFGKKYVQKRNFKTKSKSAQEAHEAIRPTDVTKENAGKNSDQKELYRLIWERTISSQMSSATLINTRILATAKIEAVPDFKITGSRVIFDGWLKVDTRARGEDTELPKVKKDEDLKLNNIESEEKETTPPNRYTEAGLVKELEKRGIGRPSTYAAIIDTLQKRHYVEKEGRTLYPTDTGDVVSSFLEEHFEDYISDDFTAEMEDKLDEMAEGKREYENTLKNFYKPFHQEVQKKEKEAGKITDLGPAPDEYKCPKCDADMVIKLGRNGKFMSCSKFPDCDGARTIDGEEVKEPEALGTDPETDEPIYILDGPYGPYVQLGKKEKGKKKPKRASIPKEKEADDVTLENALKYLSLPRTLGKHPETDNEIQANIGRFGPYIAHMTEPKPDYRSLKDDNDDPYTITLERALEILSEPKKRRGGRKKKKKS